MRRSGRSAAVLLVLLGVFAVAAASPGAWRSPAADAADIDAKRRLAAEAHAFNRHLAAELAAGRIPLAEAVERTLEANVERPDFLPAIHASVGGATPRASVAISLVHRAEHPLTGPPVARPALRAEFAAVFGHPYTPPRP